MKISKKLLLGFSVVILFTTIMGILGISGINTLREASLSMYQNEVLGLEYIGKAEASFKQMRIDCSQVIMCDLYDDQEGAIAAKENFEKSAEKFVYWLEESKKIAGNEELLKFYQKITEMYWNDYSPKANTVVELSIHNTPDHDNKLYINVLLVSLMQIGKQIDNLIVGAIDVNVALAERANNTNGSLTHLLIRLQIFLLAAAVIAAVIIAIYITRSVSIPINESLEALSKIAKGDFHARVTGNYKGEMELIKNSVNETAGQLLIYLNEKLQEEKARELAAITTIVDAGIIIKDKNGVITNWNTGAEKILGYAEDEIIGKTAEYFTPGEDHHMLIKSQEQLKKGEHTTLSEDVRIHKNGHMVNCSASYTPLFDNDGDFDGSVIIFHDITEQKVTEQKIRRLAAIFATAVTGIIIKDKDGVIQEWNVGAENILGFKSEEMIGCAVQCYVPEEYHEVVDDIDRRLSLGERIPHVETIRKRKDGRLINCSTSYTPILDDNKKYMGAVAIFHDITREKLAEEKAQNLAAIVTIADAGIIVKDKNGVVREWNIGAENILGYKPEDVIGHTTHYYATEESYAGIDEIEARLENGEHIVNVEVVRKHKNGRLVDCSASYTPVFGDSGEFDGSVAIFHDITDKKQIELALKEALLVAEEKHQTIVASMEYARKIQKSLLPRDSVFEQAFSDYSVIWKPRDTVGGDIYWIKSFGEGTILCGCDCTGHGTPGALLTMLVISAFESSINESNYKDTAQIIWELEQRLVNVFNVNSDIKGKSRISDVRDGCDLAVLYIANDGHVTLSSGSIHLFICNGKEVTKIKGQKIFVGEGMLKSKDDVRVVHIPPNPDNKFYFASDGLYDQIGGEHERPFGYADFKRIILQHHNEKQSIISDMIWEAFESYMGKQPRRDDVGLITFIPRYGKTG